MIDSRKQQTLSPQQQQQQQQQQHIMDGLRSQQDSQAWECHICLNEYSWRRRAKLLACQHTCCSACLRRMVTVRRGEADRDGTEAVTGRSDAEVINGGSEARLTDRDGETMTMTVQNERRTNPSDARPGQEVIVCPWCRGVTALPDGLSVDRLPDDQEKMAAVTPTTPPPPLLAQEYMPVFIRLLPVAGPHPAAPWSADGDGNRDTGVVVTPSSAHYLLPMYMERDHSLRDSVIISTARRYLLSAGRAAAYFDAEDVGELRVAQRCLLPPPGQRWPPPPPPGTRDSSFSGTGAGAWREEGERVDLRAEERLRDRLRDRRRDEEEEEKRSSRRRIRACTVVVLCLIVLLLVCIILHAVACPSSSFTVISCG